MLDNFVFSLNAALPVFLVMAVGFILNRLGLFPKEYAALTDKFVFRAALPVLLFKDISEMDFKRDFDLRFVAFCAAVTVVMFLAVWAISVLFLRDKSMVGAFAQGSARGSAAILGIALATNIYGSAGHAPLMVLAAVPLFNVMSVIILSFSAKNGEKKANIKKIFVGIVTNPIILGIVCGLPFCIFDIQLPSVVSETVGSIGKTATPMALLSIGAAINLADAKKKFAPALAASLIKLLVLPAVFLPLAVHLGFSGSALVSVFIMTGSPATVACYIMAKNMDNDYVLTSNIVVLSTLASVFSLTFWVFVLKNFSLI